MNHYFECECGHNEHTYSLTSTDDGDESELYFNFQLSPRNNFFNRVLASVKYIFGYQCKYGHWDTIQITEDDLDRLFVLLHQHKVKVKNNRKKETTI
jgi:hypothetical protein